MISHEYKAIFIHIPKCAGTSIESAFQHFVGDPYLKAQDHRTVRELEPLSLKSYLSKENRAQLKRKKKFLHRHQVNKNNLLEVTKSQWDSYLKFSIVRNPWARIESGYRGFMRNKERLKARGIDSDLTFEAFCKFFVPTDNLTIPQMFWLKNFNGEIGVDKVIKFHDLKEETQEMANDYGFPLNDLPNLLSHKKSDYRKVYTDDTAEFIYEKYKEEIDIFNFKFDDEFSGG